MAVLGCITLLIFILRLIIFTFRESPKFLLAKGYDHQALDVLHAIARFNKAPPPSLTMLGEHKSGFGSTGDTAPLLAENGRTEKEVDEAGGFSKTFGHLRGLFETRTSTYLFVMTALAWVLAGVRKGISLMERQVHVAFLVVLHCGVLPSPDTPGKGSRYQPEHIGDIPLLHLDL